MKKILIVLSSFVFLASSFFVSNKKEVRSVQASRPEYDIPLLGGETFDYDNAIFDDFDNGINPDRWWLNEIAWANVKGRTNGGVVPENVFYDANEGTAILRTAGDYYAEGNIQTPPRSLTTGGRRSGADLVSKFLTYPGRYEVRMKVAPRYGVCTTMWTYIECGDYVASLDGRHNHEIDIELPWSGDFKQVSFGNYVGGFEETMHTSEKVTLDNYLNDGEYHTFGFDWYYNDNNNHKIIRYYIDGVILSEISKYVPFYKTKVNIGIWCPDSKLAGTPPLYDQAYCDIDYFKYIPFKNHHHEDAVTYKTVDGVVEPRDAYSFDHGADLDEYPSISTPNIVRNYFPNGKFDFVNKLNSSYWNDITRTGIENSGVTIAKTTYDRNNSTNSGGALIAFNGYLAGYIDSCHQGQKYNLSIDYKNKGSVYIKSFDENDILLSTLAYDLEQANTWENFSQNITLTDSNVSYIALCIHADKTSSLTTDNIVLALGHKSEEIDPTYDHFMASFHENPAVIDAFEYTNGVSSPRKNNLIIEGMDNSSNIAWQISTAKYENKREHPSKPKPNDFNSITIGTASSLPDDEDYFSIRNCVNTEVTLSGYQAILFSTSYIQNINDLSLSWSSASGGFVSVVYKFRGGNWIYLNKYNAESTHDGSGVDESWNRRMLILNDKNPSFASTLKGQTAKIGFLYSNQGSSSECYLRLNTLCVNKISSMKGKINYWSTNSTHLCQTGGSLLIDKSPDKTALLMVNYGFDADDANALDTIITVDGSAKEHTYFNQFAYLCDIAGINISTYPSNYAKQYSSNDNDIAIVVVAFFGIVSIICLSYLIRRKRRI